MLMLSKQRIEEVVMAYIFKPSTPDNALKMAQDLGLPAGSVRFGPTAIVISEGDKTTYVQIAGTGNSVVLMDDEPPK